MNEQQPTVAEFMASHGITMTVQEIGDRPDGVMEDMPSGSSHWRCVFRNGRTLTCYFSMGPAHVGPPEADHVLDALASDASLYDNSRSFEEFAQEMGYSEDSRRAQRIYRACATQSRKLKQFLGEVDFQSLLYETDGC